LASDETILRSLLWINKPFRALICRLSGQSVRYEPFPGNARAVGSNRYRQLRCGRRQSWPIDDSRFALGRAVGRASWGASAAADHAQGVGDGGRQCVRGEGARDSGRSGRRRGRRRRATRQGGGKSAHQRPGELRYPPTRLVMARIQALASDDRTGCHAVRPDGRSGRGRFRHRDPDRATARFVAD
jgi:hypothetical protein